VKADLLRWSQIARLGDKAHGATVLLEGGLVTVRFISPAIGGELDRASHWVHYSSPVCTEVKSLVKASHLTAIMLGSGNTEQEGHATP
jgi:hypothetical protein